ncbi:MAG: type II secretion system protein GspD [Desulfobacteraceae bacterium 4572_87]|nr:MAG: type II secretion system protein GspD [Desulfobacteraceae bacterium 4572_87]
MRVKMRYQKPQWFFLFVWLFTALFLLSVSVEAARVTGEDGVAPAVPKQAVQVQKSKTTSPVKPSVAAREEISLRSNDTEPAVTIDFDRVDIPIFIKFISELTGKNFVIDKGVRGKVTIISPNKITVDEAYKVFESVLEVHGFTTVPSGNIIKIVPAASARTKSVETRLRRGATLDSEDKVVTQLIPLRYAEPDELKKLFSPFISKSSVMVSYPPTRTLIVTDVMSNIQRLLSIARAIDVEGVGEEISVIPLEYASASPLAKSLNSVFERRAIKQKRTAGPQTVTKIVADERTNSLVVVSSEDDAAKIRKLVKLLDKEAPRGKGDIHVFYLQHANAEELTKVLTAIPSKKTTEKNKGKAPILSKDARIVADQATNSLVIMADQDDYLVLEEVIQKLDIPRMMVFIEALFMEVNVEKDFNLGVEWQGIKTFSYDGKNAGAFAGSSPSGIKTAAGIVSGLKPGFSMGVISDAIKIAGVEFPNLAAVVNAYQQDRDVHILSTPQILTTDNEEAEIMVGKNVPYQVRQETTDAQLNYSSYEYKDVGVTLKITPQISQERFVRLKIYEEVTRLVDDTVLASTGRPETWKRLAQTTVIVKDAQTVVIGGLIGDETTNIDYKVPCLGSLPLLGWLFKGTSKNRQKTNLFIFLTPRIIQNPSEARKIYLNKKEQIETIKEGVIKMYDRPKPKPLTDETPKIKR